MTKKVPKKKESKKWIKSSKELQNKSKLKDEEKKKFWDALEGIHK